ncbi:dephospho-CoA kinase [Endozoicomonas montiporae]|uniref:Dephospho-CoA kinase n=2 Tax=Endozoicomonas montiporae TaxID=1027273 RepID=A0A081N7L5_9GAMM|nr:dephospho-CoA kinase [Endozoicomonas montiporae]AMO55721.1 dephospho-CoA kinase [Endozoicomonas montiporae CL-33]KEQ14438.1 dephospho-CoA kinase [Endozoicomonas montiporae]
MSLVIGVTGGIGSGKTSVTDYFASLGIVVVDADQAARVVVEPGQPALEAIAQRYDGILHPEDGSLNRRKLREIIFANDDEKVWLEQLLHPLIREQIISELKASESPYTILVSPLMIETDQHLLTNRILVVDAPEDIQIARTINRDSMTEAQTRSIIAKQATREERKSRADDLVDNSQSLEQLYQQLDKLHQLYLHLAEPA